MISSSVSAWFDSTRTVVCAVLALACLCAIIQAEFPIVVPELPLLLLGVVAAIVLQHDKKTEGRHRQKRSPERKRDRAFSATSSSPAAAVCEPLPPRIFAGLGLEEQVSECVEQLHLTKYESLLEQVRIIVLDKLKELVPQVTTVSIFVSGDIFARYSSCAVAVPDVEVVVQVGASELRESMLKHCTKERVDGCNPMMLQKLAVRTFSKAILQIPQVKFRRSAFQAEEPKVTLLWAVKDGTESFGFDFSVNHSTAQRNAALMSACTELDVRAKHLLLIVRRWAKDRGICHAQKHHLPPYAWSILVIYFLQLGLGEDRLLPAFRFYDNNGRPSVSPDESSTLAASQLTVADLLIRFFQFYASPAAWATEVISVIGGDVRPGTNTRTLARGSPLPRLEDPFQRSSDLSAILTPVTLDRMHEELQRASLLVNASTGCLAKLLEPWAPPG